ncbi:MAG: T9SS type A sorting domain-containing protein [Bacteroidetes bacterium]|nr:T9SS type A sorting domain-containing protein [Bacteroidota bacterium]
MTHPLLKYFYSSLLLVLLLISPKYLSAQATWMNIPTGTQFTIHELSFPNDSVGYFVCDTADFNPQGKVYRTQNRGQIWSFVNYTSHNLFHIDAPSQNTVYVNGNNGSYSVLRRSINGGQTWLNMNVNSPEGPMDFVNDSLGFIGSSGGPGNRIWRTTNNGNSFDSALIGGSPSAMFDLQYVTDSIAYAGGLYGPKLSKTTQQLGGWSDQTNDYAVLSVCFLDPDTGYATAEFVAVSSPLAVIKTTDGGLTWTQLPNSIDPAGNGWAKIHCRNTLECICVGGGGSVASTDDGGFTWNIENSGTTNNLSDVFYGSNYAVAVGEYGTVLRRIIVPTGAEETSDVPMIRLYPNPANDRLNITADMHGGDLITILDVSGRTIHMELISGTTSSVAINIASFSEGIYLVKMNNRPLDKGIKFSRVHH